MKINGFHHVSMKCSLKEYDSLIDFYRNILGLSIVRFFENGCMFDLGNGYLEIFNDGDVLPKGTIRHFALSVDSVEKVINELRSQNVKITMEPKGIVLSDFKAKIAFIEGPIGESIEFVEVYYGSTY